MILFILFSVIAIIILDLYLLRDHSLELFHHNFQMKRFVVISLLAPLFLILGLASDLIRVFAIYFVLVILPFYLIKRPRYLKN